MPTGIRFFTVLLAVGMVASGQSTARIGGRILNESGNGVAGVSVILQPQSSAGAPGSTISSPGGTYDFRGLPAGRYTICVHSPSGAYLNPCLWSPMETLVEVRTGQTLDRTVAVRSGARLRVRLSDPSQLSGLGGGGTCSRKRFGKASK